VSGFDPQRLRQSRLATIECELVVEPQQVVLGKGEASDGRCGFKATMRAMPVVSVQPDGQLGSALG
jgi:hypothetical protein